MNLYKFYIFLLLLTGQCQLVVFAQSPSVSMGTRAYIDSLKKELLQTEKKDTNYLKSEIRLAARLAYVEPVAATRYALDAAELGKKSGNKRLYAAALGTLGNTYIPQNNYLEALSAHNLALKIAREINDVKIMAEMYNSRGIVYKNMEALSQSLTSYLEAEKIFDSLRNIPGMARVSNNLAGLYKRNNQTEKALEYYEKAKRQYQRAGHHTGYASVQINLGIIYKDLEQFDLAEAYLDSALSHYVSQGIKLQEVLTKNSLANLYIKMGEHEKAEAYLKETLRMSQDLNLREYEFYASIYYVSVDIANNDFPAAYKNLERSKTLADSLDNISLLSMVEKQWAQVNKEEGKYEEALEHFEAHKRLEDSTQQYQKDMFMMSQKVQRELFEREKTLAEQEKSLTLLEEKISLENRWKWSLGIVAVLALLTGFLFYQRYQSSRAFNKKLEDQNQLISSQKAELEAADQLKTRFFTNISHEFRTPLNLILGPLRTNQEDIPPNELNMMQRNAERLLRLVNQLLDLSKLEGGKLAIKEKNIDLFGFLQDLASSFAPQAEAKNIRYQIDIPPGNKFVRLDPEKVEKIVFNLLSNAFKFTPSGGQVNFFASLDSAMTLLMAVSDTGLGVPRELQDKVFDRFYQVDGSSTRTFEGTGIGLSLTKELTEMLGGSISIESEVRAGCRFKVVLPLKEAEPGEGIDEVALLQQGWIPQNREENSGAVPPVLPDEAPLILVVEDNEELRRFLISRLGNSFKIMEAPNGEAGLEIAREHLPDVVITDVMMPLMDGVEMTNRLKSDPITSHIPVIILTAKDDPQTRRDGFVTGADQYLPKPFDPEEVRARVNSLLAQNQRLREKYSRAVYLKPAEVEVEDHEAAFLDRLMQVLEENMDNSEFTVEQLQREAGMSRMQLHRKLKALTGKSASEFIRNIRLQRAAELLKHPGAQVADVAYRVGFSHLSYFSKCFREQFGVVPSAYTESLSN